MRQKVLLTAVISTVALSGCNKSIIKNSDDSTSILKRTPALLAQQSADNIDENTSGLVSANTVYSWVSDWEQNRPNHINGRLFVLQFNPAMSGNADYSYIKHDDVNVFTYNANACCVPASVRNDGVSNDPKAFLDGKAMDALLASTGINPEEDMILVVMGENTSNEKGFSNSARLWEMFAYWGVSPKNLSLLNGSATHQMHPAINDNVNSFDDIYVKNASMLLGNGTYKISGLKVDATSTVISMGGMMQIAAKADKSGIFIVDSRSPEEFAASKQAKTEEKSCGVDGATQCYTAFDGRINGAVNIDYRETYNYQDQTVDLNQDGVVDIKDASSTFKTKPELESLYSDRGYTNGDTIYSYCRTGVRVSSNVFAQSQILGYPTVTFDGGWIQWGKMANAQDKNNNIILAADNQWRTDLPEFSELVVYNTDNKAVQQVNGLNPSADNTDAIIKEDRAYKN